MSTVHDLTLEFNELVPQAREKGVAMWAKHHRSDFSSRQVAEEQVARLRAALHLPPAPISAQGPPAPISGRVLEVTLQLPKDEDWVLAGPSVDWTATAVLKDGRRVEHKSRATDWFIAMMLAIASWRKAKAVPPREELVVHMERR